MSYSHTHIQMGRKKTHTHIFLIHFLRGFHLIHCRHCNTYHAVAAAAVAATAMHINLALMQKNEFVFLDANNGTNRLKTEKKIEQSRKNFNVQLMPWTSYANLSGIFFILSLGLMNAIIYIHTWSKEIEIEVKILQHFSSFTRNFPVYLMKSLYSDTWNDSWKSCIQIVIVQTSTGLSRLVVMQLFPSM